MGAYKDQLGDTPFRLPDPPPSQAFSGPAYDPDFDYARLKGQLQRIFDLMRDAQWRTLAAISAATGEPEASVSAQLRHLRKPRYGSWIVEKRRAGGGWEYRVLPPSKAAVEPIGGAYVDEADMNPTCDDWSPES